MDEIMGGEATPAQIGGFLVALRAKGETADEIAGCAEAMREHVAPGAARSATTSSTRPARAATARGTFNISTAAALVAAAAGAGVAKHGNRAVVARRPARPTCSRRSASRSSCRPSGSRSSIDELGFGFMFAPAHHPAMRHAAPVRRELGDAHGLQRARPADEPGRRARAGLRRLRARARARRSPRCSRSLGARRAFVVHGAGGIDELSPAGPEPRRARSPTARSASARSTRSSSGSRAATPTSSRGGDARGERGGDPRGLRRRADGATARRRRC